MEEIVLIGLLLLAIAYWWDTTRTNEIAIQSCRRICQAAGVQLDTHSTLIPSFRLEDPRFQMYGENLVYSVFVDAFVGTSFRGRASAQAFLLALIIIIVSVIQFRGLGKRVHYQ